MCVLVWPFCSRELFGSLCSPDLFGASCFSPKLKHFRDIILISIFFCCCCLCVCCIINVYTIEKLLVSEKMSYELVLHNNINDKSLQIYLLWQCTFYFECIKNSWQYNQVSRVKKGYRLQLFTQEGQEKIVGLCDAAQNALSSYCIVDAG